MKNLYSMASSVCKHRPDGSTDITIKADYLYAQTESEALNIQMGALLAKYPIRDGYSYHQVVCVMVPGNSTESKLWAKP